MAAAKTKTTFKQSYEDFRTLMKQIDNRLYKRVYLLTGEEPYFTDRLVDKLSRCILTPEEQDFGQTVFYGADAQAGDVAAACREYPIGSERNVVIVKEAQKIKNIDQLQHYLKNPADTTVLVLAFRGENIDKRSAVYKRCKETGTVYESVRPRDYEISEWITELFRNRGKSIGPKAMAMLVEYLGTDLKKIENETDKLVTRLNEQTSEITPEDIEQNIGISKDFNTFELTRALSERNLNKALLIAEHFAGNPKENPFVVTIQLLFNHFLRIFTLGIIYWNCKKKRQPVPDDLQLAKTMKLSNAFFLKEYRQALSHFPTQRSFAILGLIREYDMKSKGLETGNVSEGDLLKELIFKIFTA